MPTPPKKILSDRINTNAEQITYAELANSASDSAKAGFDALVNQASPSHKAELQERLSNALQHFPPAIGQYWHGQGGIYAGIVRDGDRQRHLLLGCTVRQPQAIAATRHYSPDDCAITGPWGKYGGTIEGEFSRYDGQHNTQLILAAEPQNKIANYITSLEIDGHRDLYWPSQFEQNLLRINLPEHLSPEWHWSSTQYSARYAWIQTFEDGYQGILSKLDSLAARAVRSILII